ncbi:MAG: hypothetical protein V1860_03755 [bacterium]
MRKSFREDYPIVFNKKWSRDIISLESKDTFILDYYVGRIQLIKFTYNKRYRASIILVRFDSHGLHTNPDNKQFDGPHVHIYKEGFDDKFAFPVSEIGVDENAIGKEEVLKTFLNYCNVKDCSKISLSLI